MHCSNATAATSESLTGVNEVGDVTLKTTVEEDVKYGAAAVINVSGEVEILRSRAETQ